MFPSFFALVANRGASHPSRSAPALHKNLRLHEE